MLYVTLVSLTAYVILIKYVSCHTSIASLGFFNSQFVICNEIHVEMEPYLRYKFEIIFKLIADKCTVSTYSTDSRF